jgi:hypothetical protein
MANEELRDILVSGNIPDIKINSTDASASVSTKAYVDAEIATLSGTVITDKGFLALGRNASETLLLNDDYDVVPWVNTTVIDASNNHVEYDFTNDRIIFKSVGVYQVIAFGTVGGENNVEYQFSYFLDNQSATGGASPFHVGSGLEKPFTASDAGFMNITQGMLDDATVSPAGQVWLDIRVRAETSGQLTDMKIHSATLSIEKKV